MIIARLIDLEGVTVAEMALPDSPKNPRWYVYRAVMPKITFMVEPLDPMDFEPPKTVEYRLERCTGDGIHIYRRVTGPWG